LKHLTLFYHLKKMSARSRWLFGQVENFGKRSQEGFAIQVHPSSTSCCISMN